MNCILDILVYSVLTCNGRVVVLKISGRLLNPYYEFSKKLFHEYSRVLSKLYDKGYHLGVVVGGGDPARKYIGLARELGVNETLCDILGIMVSRLNAQTLIALLGGKAYPQPPCSLEEYLRAWSTGRIVISGGFQPGQSTNAVSALVVEALNTRKLYMAASVDAVYDKDPKKHRDARRIVEITLRELKKIIEQEFKAGAYQLLDPLAINILERSRIEVVLFDGRKPQLLLRALEGENPGTIIKP